MKPFIMDIMDITADIMVVMAVVMEVIMAVTMGDTTDVHKKLVIFNSTYICPKWSIIIPLMNEIDAQ